jgi:hypothetical protein
LVALVVSTLTLASCAKRSPRPGVQPARAKAAAKKAAKEADRPAAEAGQAVAVVVAPKAPAHSGLVEQIKGWGRNQQEAEQDVIKNAGKFLAGFLRRQQSPLTLTPSPDFIRQLLLREGQPQRREDEDLEVDGPDGAKIKVQCWTATLAVTPEDYQALVRLERDTHHKEQRPGRMEVVAKGFAGVLAGLVVLLGFIRVGQWSTGLWTRRVRVVVACLLVAAVAGFLCLS